MNTDAFPERETLQRLRRRKPARSTVSLKGLTLGERIADLVAAVMGSWTFIVAQSLALCLWIALNAYSGKAWDPYPFILLNLALSFQAAYAAPIILMSQNRESQIDREKLDYTYHVEMKNELELELLHHKMDEMLALLRKR